MKKEQRAAIAAETLAILEAGSYDTPAGVTVTIEDELEACLDATKYFSPDTLLQLLEQELAVPSEGLQTKIEVVNETTLEGIAALVAQGQAEAAAAGVQARKKKYEASKRNNDLGIAALNFASARNPGGGFLNGAQAQEESLARSSALYVSQQQAIIFYERHLADDSLLYSDAMILTPDCPIIRNDAGDLLDEPVLATFITSPAPNAGAIATNQPENLRRLKQPWQSVPNWCWLSPPPMAIRNSCSVPGVVACLAISQLWWRRCSHSCCWGDGKADLLTSVSRFTIVLNRLKHSRHSSTHSRRPASGRPRQV